MNQKTVIVKSLKHNLQITVRKGVVSNDNEASDDNHGNMFDIFEQVESQLP